MKALTLATSSKDRNLLDAKCKEWLTKAEKIKKADDWQSAARSRDKGPVSRPLASARKLTTREEIIILEGAKLNGFIFPPWKADPALREFEKTVDGDGAFTYAQCLLCVAAWRAAGSSSNGVL
jgi:hypothetical protein